MAGSHQEAFVYSSEEQQEWVAPPFPHREALTGSGTQTHLTPIGNFIDRYGRLYYRDSLKNETDKMRGEVEKEMGDIRQKFHLGENPMGHETVLSWYHQMHDRVNGERQRDYSDMGREMQEARDEENRSTDVRAAEVDKTPELATIS